MWGSCGALAAFVLRAATAWRALDSLPPLNACVSFHHGFCFRWVWRSLPSTAAFMLGRPGGILCSSKPYASVCDEIGCSAFACACTFTIASRLYGCGFCACDSSYGSTALTCARTCEALLLVGTWCGFWDACDSSCKSPRLPCCMTMHGVASSLLFIKKRRKGFTICACALRGVGCCARLVLSLPAAAVVPRRQMWSRLGDREMI